MPRIFTYFAFLSFFFSYEIVYAQYLVPEQGADTIRVCSGTVSDRVNHLIPYNYGRNGTLTIYPGTPGYKIKLTFLEFQTYEDGDDLEIFIGNKTTNKRLGLYYARISPRTIYSNDSTGALTLRFKTSYNGLAKGFTAAIECVAPEGLPDIMASIASFDSYYYFNVFESTAYGINTINHNNDSILTGCASYLSNDEFLDSSDILIAKEDQIIYVEANETDDLNGSYSTDSMGAPGQHFNISKVDYSNSIAEANEENNVLAIPFQTDTSFVDLVPYSIDFQGSLSKGNREQLTVNVFNSGNTLSPHFSCRLVFSDDDVLDNTDNVLAHFSSNNAWNSTSYLQLYQNGGVYFPAYLPIGNHYLFLIVDDSSNVNETIESNNILRKEVNIDANFVDLFTINAGLLSLDIAPGGKAELTIKQYNRNPTNTTYFIGHYLSADTILDAGDSLIYKVYLNSSSTTLDYSIPIPEYASVGSHYLILKTDDGNYIFESNEINNNYFIPFNLIAPRADLQYESRTWGIAGNVVQNHFAPGSGVILNFDAFNMGNTKTDSCKVGFFLSLDALYDSSDNQINIRTIPLLNPNTKANVKMGGHWPVPNWLPNGKYYLLTVLDLYNSIPETNETNNIRVDSIYIGAPSLDLIYGHLQISNSRFMNTSDSIRVIGSFVEDGFNPSTNLICNYYLSTKKEIDSSAILLKSYAPWSYNPPNWTVDYPYIHLPASLAAGAYYLIIEIDVTNIYPESDETNNLTYVPISIYNGTLQFDSIPYLQHDTVFTCFDNIICDSLTNGLLTLMPSISGNKLCLDIIRFEGSGGSVILYDGLDTAAAVITSFAYPNSSYPSLYASNTSGAITLQVKKWNSAQNQKLKAIVHCVSTLPIADLSISNPYSNLFDTPAKAGDFISRSILIKNQGGTPANSADVGIYISENDTLDINDLLLDTITVGKILAGTQLQINKGFHLPSILSNGWYTIFFKLDYDSAVSESFEANNIYSFTVNIQNTLPDLTIRSVKFTTYAPAKNPYEMDAQLNLRNQGAVCLDSIYVALYISSDSLLDSADVELNENYVWQGLYSGTINGTQSNFNFHKKIPLTFAPGNYYLIFKIDSKNDVSETNENNNLITHPIQLVPRVADIAVLGYDAIFYRDNAGGGHCRVTNFNSMELGNWIGFAYSKTAFYLSIDTLLDAADLLVDSGNNSNMNWQLNVSPGNYYLLCKMDYHNAVAEVNELNNFGISALTVPDSTYELGISSLTVFRKTLLAGKEFGARIHFSNSGGNNIQRALYKVFLSLDTIPDVTDILLYRSYLQSHSDVYNVKLKIDENTAPGLYYVLALADANDSIVETDETNNMNFVPLNILPNSKDLTFKNVSLSSPTVAPGYTVVANATAYNHGNIELKSTLVAYYLSPDSVLDPGDLFLTHSYQASLEAGSYSYKNTYITIPASASIGNNYILFFVDDSNQVIENNENNNIRALPITVGTAYTDLTLKSPVLSNVWLSAGDIAMAKIQVSNSGNIYCSSSNLAYYFSKDTVLDSLDILLDSSTGSALAANGSELRQQSLAIPASADTGNYFILFQVDQTNLVIESNEGNNLQYIPINISLVGIKEQIPVEDITISPNPFRSKIKIEFGNNFKKSITVFDISGRIIYQKKEILESSSEINTANWAEGIYFIDIKQDQKEFRKKLIKLN